MKVEIIRKRILISVSILIVMILAITVVIGNEIRKIDACTYDYREKLIRFHVIANSDSEDDQELKLKVRDAVIAYLEPKLEKSSSIEESEEIIKGEYKNLEKISSSPHKICISDFISKYGLCLYILSPKILFIIS